MQKPRCAVLLATLIAGAGLVAGNAEASLIYTQQSWTLFSTVGLGCCPDQDLKSGTTVESFADSVATGATSGSSFATGVATLAATLDPFRLSVRGTADLDLSLLEGESAQREVRYLYDVSFMVTEPGQWVVFGNRTSGTTSAFINAPPLLTPGLLPENHGVVLDLVAGEVYSVGIWAINEFSSPGPLTTSLRWSSEVTLVPLPEPSPALQLLCGAGLLMTGALLRRRHFPSL